MSILKLLFYLFLGQYMPYPGAVNNVVISMPGTPFITGQTIGTLRSNFTGCVGFSFSTGAAPITITDLGRWVVAGNSATHTVDIVIPAISLVAQAVIVTSGATANAYAYTAITPVVLSATTNYNVVSTEVNGGDQWGDNNTSVTHTSVGTVNQAVVDTAPPNCIATSGANASLDNSYVPTNFKYF